VDELGGVFETRKLKGLGKFNPVERGVGILKVRRTGYREAAGSNNDRGAELG